MIKNILKSTNIKEILIIQKFIRHYVLIPSSKYQTKNWRKSTKWYIDGRHNECEKYQINQIEKILSNKLNKTNERINIESVKIINIKNPNINDDGYDYTENFDGCVIKNNNTYYFNLKFVCDSGGAQTRTLREVNTFIKYQLEYLIKHNTNNIYFINILDGNQSYDNINKFNYLKNKDKYKQIVKYVFIGSLHDFQINKNKFYL